MWVTERITEQLSLELDFGHDALDTKVEFNGFVWIAGQNREDFINDFTMLIERYRI